MAFATPHVKVESKAVARAAASVTYVNCIVTQIPGKRR